VVALFVVACRYPFDEVPFALQPYKLCSQNLPHHIAVTILRENGV